MKLKDTTFQDFPQLGPSLKGGMDTTQMFFPFSSTLWKTYSGPELHI